MLVYMLVLIVVVAAMVAIIVNRKSLVACVVIATAATFSCSFFLALYDNAHKFASYGALLRFTIISSVVLIAALLAVTYIGVNMFFKKKKSEEKSALPFEMQSGAVVVGNVEANLIPGTDIRPAPVGIFGRQVIVRTSASEEQEVIAAESTKTIVVEKPIVGQNAAPVQVIESSAQSIDDQNALMLKRATEKAAQFMTAGQYMLAEQMYGTYLKRCTDPVTKADVEILMLECRVAQGDKECATQQLAMLIGKLRSGEYMLSQKQKMDLAQAKMNIAKMQ